MKQIASFDAGDRVEDKFKTENVRKGTVMKLCPQGVVVKFDGEEKLKRVSAFSIEKIEKL